MTRWARGGPANKKKAHDSTPWTPITGGIKASTHKKDRRKRPHGTFIINKTSNREEAKNTKKDVSRDREPVQSGLAAELEKLKSSVNLTEKEQQEISGVIHKDERREKRRIKRINDKDINKVCFNCRQTGHGISDCPESRRDEETGTGICFKCGSTEHSIGRCREKVPEGEFPYAKCFICGETGHLSKQCPDNPRGLYPKGGCCRECGSVEHFKKDCPDLQKKKGIPDLTLSTLDNSTSMDEESSFQIIPPEKPSKKIIKVVKF